MLSKLRSDHELKGIPVIMLTAEAGRETVLKIAKLGVRDYLVKPFQEEAIIERVGRVIQLRTKGESTAKQKRFDDPISVLLVDDKPAIVEQIKSGLADTPWKITAVDQPGKALDSCSQETPDLVLISLSLPNEAAITLFQGLRGQAKMKNVPIFALSVKTAVDEQAAAQKIGFTGIITKPIDVEKLKGRIARSLNLDTSYKYFQQKDGVQVITIPKEFNDTVESEITSQLESKLNGAVDSGLSRVVVDASALEKADMTVVMMVISITKACQGLSLQYALVGSQMLSSVCQEYEEAQFLSFSPDFAQAVAKLDGGRKAA